MTENERRHSKRQRRICYSVEERDSDGKNRDWVSLLIYKEVAGGRSGITRSDDEGSLS